MSKESHVSHPIHLVHTEVKGFDSLAELALDMRWSWNHATDGVWRTLNPILWESLKTLGLSCRRSRGNSSEHVLADPVPQTFDNLLQAKRQASEKPAWFQQRRTKLT